MWTRGCPPILGTRWTRAEYSRVQRHWNIFSNIYLHNFETLKWPRLETSRTKWFRINFEVGDRSLNWFRTEIYWIEWFRSDFDPNFPDPNRLEIIETSKQFRKLRILVLCSGPPVKIRVSPNGRSKKSLNNDPKTMQNRCSKKRGSNDANNLEHNAKLIQQLNQILSYIY